MYLARLRRYNSRNRILLRSYEYFKLYRRPTQHLFGCCASNRIPKNLSLLSGSGHFLPTCIQKVERAQLLDLLVLVVDLDIINS